MRPQTFTNFYFSYHFPVFLGQRSWKTKVWNTSSSATYSTRRYNRFIKFSSAGFFSSNWRVNSKSSPTHSELKFKKKIFFDNFKIVKNTYFAISNITKYPFLQFQKSKKKNPFLHLKKTFKSTKIAIFAFFFSHFRCISPHQSMSL